MDRRRAITTLLGTVALLRLIEVPNVAAEPASYPAAVLRVIDGDSLKVKVEPWPGIWLEPVVRLLGLDAPELTAPCPGARAKAEAAKALVERLAAGQTLRLAGLAPGKFQGRYLAQAILPDGRDLGALLLAEGLAQPWSGQGPKPDWCR